MLTRAHLSSFDPETGPSAYSREKHRAPLQTAAAEEDLTVNDRTSAS
jgi:hypothetical protein